MPRYTIKEVSLASGQSAKVIRIDARAFSVVPFFTQSPPADEITLAKLLAEARLKMPLTPVPTADIRMTPQQTPEGIRLAQRAAPREGAALAPQRLLRTGSAELVDDELLINANHFLFLPPEVITPFDAYGDPIGLTLADGIIQTPPQVRRTCLTFGSDGAAIRRIGFPDLQITACTGADFTPQQYGPPGEGTAYALFHGSIDGCTPTAPDAWDVAFVGRHSVALKEGGGLSIPRAGCVLRCASQSEAEAVADQPLRYSLPDLSQGVQAGPIIVEDGHLTMEGRNIFAEEGMYPDPNRPDDIPVSPHDWAANWHDTRAARLSAGLTDAGELFFCAVEGSSSFLKGSPAKGATLHDLAMLMIDQGAKRAMHLDGGASTQIFTAGGGALVEPRDIYHRHEDSPAQFDRPLPLGLRIR